MRNEGCRIYIPPCKDMPRRLACLDDPELFCVTYFKRWFYRDFGKLHKSLLSNIVEIATYGGRKAKAAPRGRGKTQITKGGIIYCICKGLIRFPVPVCSTTAAASGIYEDIRKGFTVSDELAEDFPEICVPIRELQGSPQRAGHQHIDGQLTNIIWRTDMFRLADVPEKYRNGIDYGGVRMEFRGLDAAIRGINRDGDRPDFVPIDDPETKESSKSITQINDRREAIDKDVAGLAGEDVELAIVMLTTVQNNYSLSAEFTDPERRPAWMGDRMAWVEKWPDEFNKGGVPGVGLWHDYMAQRMDDQRKGDRYGRNATKLFLENREAMEAGGVLLADNYKFQELPDGWITRHSAWQEVFDTIADTSYEAFCTEYQNQPPKTEEIEAVGLTPAKVMTRFWKEMEKGDAPKTTLMHSMAIDIGNHGSHWIDIAWEGNAIGTICDYEVAETYGLNKDSDSRAIEISILATLEKWADEVVSKINPQIVLVDSGSGVGHTEAVYEFCRRYGKPFFPCKGWETGHRFRVPDRVDGKKEPFQECWAHYQEEADVWLYHVNGEFWKTWLQKRFIAKPFEPDGETRADGSLLLFNSGEDKKRHMAIAHHFTSEEEQWVPQFERPPKRVWKQKSRNNHWLDAGGYACAAAAAWGIRLIEPTLPPPPKHTPVAPLLDPHGRPFLITQRSDL